MSGFIERTQNKSRRAVLVFDCGLVPSSRGIWCLECHLLANVSRVAQHHSAAPGTQLRKGTLPEVLRH